MASVEAVDSTLYVLIVVGVLQIDKERELPFVEDPLLFDADIQPMKERASYAVDAAVDGEIHVVEDVVVRTDDGGFGVSAHNA